MARKTAKLRLMLDVEYRLNGVPVEELKTLLNSMLQEAINNGRLTGETPAEVEEHYCWQVEEIK